MSLTPVTRWLAASLVVAALGVAASAAAKARPTSDAASQCRADQPLDCTTQRETRAADFTLVAVGDLILSRPVSMLATGGAFPEAKAFADALALLKQGDVTYGNMETSIFDYRSFDGAPYSWDGDWMLTAAPAVAPDLRTMGFDILSRANNHALDWGVEGMNATIAHLSAAGLVSAGTGGTAAAATAPAFFVDAGRTTAIVSMVSTYRPTTNALAPNEVAPTGRPGVNGLAVRPTAFVDATTFQLVREVACSFAPVAECPRGAKGVSLFGTSVRGPQAGETPFNYGYSVDGIDQARNASAIASAKRQANYVLATIHAHEALSDEVPPTTWQDPAAFLKPLAEAMIDAGADAFIVTGIHHVAGIDIYRGKPIFYGLGNFFWSDMQEPLSTELYNSIFNRELLAASFEHPDRSTDADLTNVLNANSTFATARASTLNRTFQTVLARTFYDATGAVSSIRLYPIDLGYGQKLTQNGVPRQARDEVANMILDRIISLSPTATLAITKTVENGYTIAVATPRARIRNFQPSSQRTSPVLSE